MVKDWLGVIVRDSLLNVSVLDEVGIIETRVKELGVSGKWTIHEVSVENDDLKKVIKSLRAGLRPAWYAYLKKGKNTLIIFKDKEFKVSSKKEVAKVKEWAFKKHNILPEVFSLDL